MLEADHVAAVGFKFMYSQDKLLPQVIDWAKKRTLKLYTLYEQMF